MKFIIVTIAFLMAKNLLALPILNAPLGLKLAENLYTVLKDHKDKHQYYIAPNYFRIKDDGQQRHSISFTRISSKACRKLKIDCKKKSLLSTIFEGHFGDLSLNELIDAITKIDKKAKVAPLPYQHTYLSIPSAFQIFVSHNHCAQKAGQSYDHFACSIILNKKGHSFFLKKIWKKEVVPFQFSYNVLGVKELADGSFIDHSQTFQNVVEIDLGLLEPN